jgi:hypothetical protein
LNARVAVTVTKAWLWNMHCPASSETCTMLCCVAERLAASVRKWTTGGGPCRTVALNHSVAPQ